MMAEVGASTDDKGVVASIEAKAGPLPQIALHYEEQHRLLWITLRPEPKPVLTLPLIDSIRRVQLAVRDLWGHAHDRPILFMATRGRGPIYSLGGDLDFYLDCLARNDRSGLATYAAIASDVMLMSRQGLAGAVITLAAVQARSMGGAIDSIRSCNLAVAEAGATFSYPEVNFNHFPISAVPILSRHTGPIEAERILLSGRDYDAEEFLAIGALDAVVAKGESEAWIRRYADAARPSHRARAAIMAAFSERAGDLAATLSESAERWVSHMLSMTPSDISRLQRIATAQERLLARLLRSAADPSPVPLGRAVS